MPKDIALEDVVALAKRRGFVYQNSEIYGGLANLYDYGPMGAALLRNIRNLWWRNFIEQREDMVGVDCSIISHSKIWEASGHVAGFADAMIDCKNCQFRTRADHLIEGYYDEELKIQKEYDKQGKGMWVSIFAVDENNWISNVVDKETRYVQIEGLSTEKLDEIIKHFSIKCPKCGKSAWTSVRKFNLLFPVKLGILEEAQSLAYLRGETAQGIFTNFKNVMDSSRVKLPFGIGQLGKSFRNEITKGNFVFRTLEFEQGEIEYFFDPETSNWENLFEDWKTKMFSFVTGDLGIKQENLRWRTHSDEERSFYSKRTEDLEYQYPFGFKELWGLAYRTDYDLNQHIKFSGQDLSVLDSSNGRRYVPHVIEPAVGVNRLFLMVLCDAYWFDEAKNRVVLKLNKALAPVKVAVFPLVANKPDLVEKARGVHAMLKKNVSVMWDDRGNIGKRYMAQDEIGTPYCVTVDYQTLEDETVTIRDRDTAEQRRVKITELLEVVQ